MGDHYRTRLTHTLEVAQIARTMARALRLNEDLTEAIALGHDLGHTPFGHAGERMLNELNPHGFHHYEQSLRVVDCLENDGEGLNLTYEVRDGILKHTNQKAETREGQIVRFADVIAYINHDIDDSVRAEILTEDDVPRSITDVLGHSKSERITTLITSIINGGAQDIHMDERTAQAYDALHKFMNTLAIACAISEKRFICAGSLRRFLENVLVDLVCHSRGIRNERSALFAPDNTA
jgi:dGTPase